MGPLGPWMMPPGRERQREVRRDQCPEAGARRLDSIGLGGHLRFRGTTGSALSSPPAPTLPCTDSPSREPGLAPRPLLNPHALRQRPQAAPVMGPVAPSAPWGTGTGAGPRVTQLPGPCLRLPPAPHPASGSGQPLPQVGAEHMRTGSHSPPRQRGERMLPCLARPLPFCAQGFLPPPRTSARVFTLA